LEHDLWKSLTGYILHNWEDLCDKLHNEYIAPTVNGHYSKQKLQDLTNKTSQIPIEDEEGMLQYYWEFNRLSKPLVNARRITEGEWNAAFWRRFHPNDRIVLRECLITKYPNNPKGQAFDYKDVLKMAWVIFTGDNNFLQEPPP
jgi:hypothetical protein